MTPPCRISQEALDLSISPYVGRKGDSCKVVATGYPSLARSSPCARVPASSSCALCRIGCWATTDPDIPCQVAGSAIGYDIPSFCTEKARPRRSSSSRQSLIRQESPDTACRSRASQSPEHLSGLVDDKLRGKLFLAASQDEIAVVRRAIVHPACGHEPPQPCRPSPADHERAYPNHVGPVLDQDHKRQVASARCLQTAVDHSQVENIVGLESGLRESSESRLRPAGRALPLSRLPGC